MEDSGDAELLSAEALVDPAVAIALILCSFRHACPPAPSPATVYLPPAWVCHTQRSERRVGDNTDAGASSRRQRWSPTKPLEHRDGTSMSESCSEETLAKRSGIGGLTGGVIGAETKVVVAGERVLSVFSIPGSKRIRRSSAEKKLTLSELEAMHRSLLAHRKYLLKELEVKQKSKVVLVARNREVKQKSKVVLVARNRELKRLKMRLESRKRPNIVPIRGEVHSKRVRLPDLNIPFVLESV